MEYVIKDIQENINAKIIKNLDNNEYTIQLDDQEKNLKILSMSHMGMEFILDDKYHTVKYMDCTTSEINLIVDGVSIRINMHTNLDEIVYKNSGADNMDLQLFLKSPIPGKVVSISVTQGNSVKMADPIVVLESMKMQVVIKSHKDGIVKSIKVKEGSIIAKNDLIAEIE